MTVLKAPQRTSLGPPHPPRDSSGPTWTPKKNHEDPQRPFGNSKSINITSNLFKSIGSCESHSHQCKSIEVYEHHWNLKIFTHQSAARDTYSHKSIYLPTYTRMHIYHVCTHNSCKLYESQLKSLFPNSSICRMYHAPLRLRYIRQSPDIKNNRL